MRAVARLGLATGDAAGVVTLLRRRLGQVRPESLLAFPLLALLTDALLQEDEVAQAEIAASQLAQLAEAADQEILAGEAMLARAKVALAAGDLGAAAAFDQAIAVFLKLELPWEAAHARLGLARATASSNPEAARAETRLALAAFERLGASRMADEAAQLLRGLGAGTAPGPRAGKELTSREDEVLGLVSLGLSNAEIAQRLFISPRTVEHHVGSVLSKLNLKTRPQLVAHALRRPRPPKP